MQNFPRVEWHTCSFCLSSMAARESSLWLASGASAVTSGPIRSCTTDRIVASSSASDARLPFPAVFVGRRSGS